MSSLAMTLAPSKERRIPHVLVMAGLAIAGSLLMGGLAQWTIPLVPVPITGQTLGVLLIGASLGPVWGPTSMLLYLLEGAFGAHFFAGGGHGWSTLTLSTPSGGYLVGYPFAALVVGWLSTRGWDRSFGSSVGAMYIGEVVIYLFGIPWLMASLHMDLQTALIQGLALFVIGDTLKLLVAAGILPLGWKLTGRANDDHPGKVGTHGE